MSNENEDPLSSLTEDERRSVDLFGEYIINAIKFRTKGTTAASARARKKASEVVKLLKTVRKQLQLDRVEILDKRKKEKGQ